MSYTVQITLGLALILASCGYLESASYKRHIRQTPETVVPEFGAKIAQKNLTVPDQKLTEQQHVAKTTEEPHHLKLKTTLVAKPLKKIQNPTRSPAENDETYEGDSLLSADDKNIQKITIKPHLTSSASSVPAEDDEGFKKKSKSSEKDDALRKENVSTSKPDKSRSIPFGLPIEDISLYTSDEFHNKNNVYTQKTSPEVEKYLNFSAEHDSKTSSTRQQSSTPEYDYNYSEYTEKVTPKTDFFDSKLKSIEDGVKQNLEYPDKSSEKHSASDERDSELEDFDFDEKKLINAAEKDNGTSLDYLKYKSDKLEVKNKSNGGVRKEYTSENGTSIDFRTSYLKTDVVNEKSNDDANQIPTTDQESSGTEFNEKVNKVKTDDDKKAVVQTADKNLKKNSLKLVSAESEAQQTSSEEEPSSIDPLSGDNTSESSITVYKRGSTKSEDKVVSTTPSPLDNNINFDNKSFSIPPTGSAWTLAAGRFVPSTTTEQIRLRLQNATKESESAKVSVFNYTTVVPNEKPQLANASAPLNDTKITNAPVELNSVDVTTGKSEEETTVSTKAVKKDNSTKAELRTNKTKDISDVSITEEDETETSTTEVMFESTSTEATSREVFPTSETSVDYTKLDTDPILKNASKDITDVSLEEVASSTEMYSTTLDYDDSQTTVRAETTEANFSTTASDYDQIGSTTESMETTTDTTSILTTTSQEDEAFTTILTTATTENITETGVEKKNNKSTETNLTIPVETTTTERIPNANVSSNAVDNTEEEDHDTDIEEELEEDGKHHQQNTTKEPTGGEHEIEIIPIDPIEGEHVTTKPDYHQPPVLEPTNNSTNGSSVNQPVDKAIPEVTVETTTGVDNSSTETDLHIDPEDNSGTVAAIIISCVGAICLVILAILLIIMRKRQKRFNHLQRCTPIDLDSYNLDNVSVYNSVSGRRKGVCHRGSRRSYGNPAFDDPVSTTHSMNFAALSKFADNAEQIHAEFEEIPQVTARTNELPEGCETKNRYANVIPLPETRVFLNTIDGEPKSDYINANYVTGPQNARGYYIACQAPMTETVDDFWRMIWEQQTKVVLMLTNLYENGVEKCADYLPPSEVLDCHRLFGDYQVTLKKRDVKEKYIISSLQLKNMVSNSWREVTHLWYMGWPDRGVPTEANSIIAFLIEARSFLKFNVLDVHRAMMSQGSTEGNNSNGNAGNMQLPTNKRIPVVVHCSPGTGRTGLFIACDIAIRDFEQTRQVDIPRTVYRIRRDRASAVQTKEQYAFIYKVISLYATKLTGNALEAP